jgi:uncharacterized protein (TIGR01244 family)
MNIRTVTPDFAVAPQITVDDIPALKDAGFTSIICNRPSVESMPADLPDTIGAACAAAGLTFTNNPLTSGDLSMDHISLQGSAIEGKTLAYCASGTRSIILWAMAMAGSMPTDDILNAMDTAGYPMPQLRGQIEMLASQGMRS